jgi:hypothetical protein
MELSEFGDAVQAESVGLAPATRVMIFVGERYVEVKDIDFAFEDGTPIMLIMAGDEDSDLKKRIER